MKYKLFAVVNNNIVCDGWFAETIEEAQADHPDVLLIEVTQETKPFYIGQNITKEDYNA
jgi:hypothetical protein